MGMHKVDEAAAKALGMTTVKLHTALESGESLADVAKAQKVSVSALVKAMVTARETELAAAVKDGHLTQAQVNTMKSTLTQRITDRVNDVRPERGQGRGPRGADRSPASGSTSGGMMSTPSSAT
jgi:hypothetical protein